MDERPARLYERLRRPPSRSTVPGALPVLFFGDLFKAEVATLALNPSDQEYVDKFGLMLTGTRQRFASLKTVAADDRASLTDDQCEEAIEWMRGYFGVGKPVYAWFAGLGRVVEGLGFSFQVGSAAHLDLVQEPTKPTWSKLPPAERDSLLKADLPFLEWQIRAFPLRAVICNGATPSRHVRRQLDVAVSEMGEVARIKWWVGTVEVDGREVGFAGWDYPLSQPTGLDKEGQRELGRMLADKLGLSGGESRREAERQAHEPEQTRVIDADQDDEQEEAAFALSAEAEVATASRRYSRSKGLTHPVWDGVSLPTLRYWLRWWQDESQSAGRIENGWGREEQIERISAEIAAREAARDAKRGGADSVGSPKPKNDGQETPEEPVTVTPHTGVVTRDELLALVDARRDAVRDYLIWASDNDGEQWTHRMQARPDIPDAAEAADRFPEQWWGVVVFTCFGVKRGAETVAPHFQRPLPGPEAEAVLDGIDFPQGSIGHHRIQPAFKGAKQALVSACADADFFYNVLHSDGDFDTRYRRLRQAKLRQWGRTTSFDLLLRAGALAIGGQHYKPELAYLGGSTGPKAGFTRVWGVSLNDDTSVAWGESLLRTWMKEWQAVAEHVGVTWDKPPLEPCDQENFLCIYQERR